jgi:cobalamin biosynthesis protein CobT
MSKNSNEFTFSQPYELKRDELLNENENENEINNKEIQEEEIDEGETEPMESRRSVRTPHHLTRLRDYVIYKVQYFIHKKIILSKRYA